MPSPEDIQQQKDRLAAHRHTVAHSLAQQAAHGGAAHTPPVVGHTLRVARAEIAHIKGVLRVRKTPLAVSLWKT